MTRPAFCTPYAPHVLAPAHTSFLLHVIANQCAHWCGNPFSPQRSLASWLLFGQIRRAFRICPKCSFSFCGTARSTDCHVASLLAMTCRSLPRVSGCNSVVPGKFVVLFGFAQSIAFHFVLPQENGLPRRFAPRNDMQKFAKCSHSNALVRNDMRKVETCQRCQGALPGCRRKTFLLPAFTRFRSFPRRPSGWRARSPAR